MRIPTEAEMIASLEAVGLSPTAMIDTSARSGVRFQLSEAWLKADVLLAGREASIVKTKIEEAALWVGRAVER